MHKLMKYLTSSFSPCIICPCKIHHMQKGMMLMKTKFIALFLVAILTLSFVGCQKGTPENENNEPQDVTEPTNEEVTADEPEAIEVEFTKIELELPETEDPDYGLIMPGTEENQTTDKVYVYATMGKKNTGGYSIDIEKIEVLDKVMTVYITTEEPSEEDVTTQAITYPSVAVEIAHSSIADIEKVVFVEGNEELSVQELVLIEETGAVLYEDGTYTKEENDFDEEGWKATIEIVIEDGQIGKVTYDEVDKDGNKKRENEEFLKAFKEEHGVDYNELITSLENSLIEAQDIAQVDYELESKEIVDRFKSLANETLVDAIKVLEAETADETVEDAEIAEDAETIQETEANE